MHCFYGQELTNNYKVKVFNDLNGICEQVLGLLGRMVEVADPGEEKVRET